MKTLTFSIRLELLKRGENVVYAWDCACVTEGLFSKDTGGVTDS